MMSVSIEIKRLLIDTSDPFSQRIKWELNKHTRMSDVTGDQRKKSGAETRAMRFNFFGHTRISLRPRKMPYEINTSPVTLYLVNLIHKFKFLGIFNSIAFECNSETTFL